MMNELGSIVEEVEIARPIEGVWRTLTERTPEWLGCLRYRGELGALFYMQQDRAKAAAGDVSGATHCQILTLDPPHLFRFSWFVPGYPSTFVSFRLEAIDAQATRVRFTHEGWEQFPPDAVSDMRAMLAGGWKSFVLPALKRVAEG
jgi:uncharacterized protein YndB with AHSA1/START domain